MGILGAVWDTIGELIVWSRSTEDETDGKVAVEVARGEDRPESEVCALPGFYSIVQADDELLVLRRDDGAILLAARTARPYGYQAGDRGIITKMVHFLMRGSKFSLVKLTGSTPAYVARDGDNCDRTVNMTAWMTSVEAALNALAPGAITLYATYGTQTIATVDASSTTVEAD